MKTNKYKTGVLCASILLAGSSLLGCQAIKKMAAKACKNPLPHTAEFAEVNKVLEEGYGKFKKEAKEKFPDSVGLLGIAAKYGGVNRDVHVVENTEGDQCFDTTGGAPVDCGQPFLGLYPGNKEGSTDSNQEQLNHIYHVVDFDKKAPYMYFFGNRKYDAIYMQDLLKKSLNYKELGGGKVQMTIKTDPCSMQLNAEMGDFLLTFGEMVTKLSQGGAATAMTRVKAQIGYQK